jgi:hypothetical protein
VRIQLHLIEAVIRQDVCFNGLGMVVVITIIVMVVAFVKALLMAVVVNLMSEDV